MLYEVITTTTACTRVTGMQGRFVLDLQGHRAEGAGQQGFDSLDGLAHGSTFLNGLTVVRANSYNFV